MNIQIKPLEGIEWNDNKIPLHCPKELVEGILGKPDVYENSYYYFNHELRFDFNDKNELEFIEFLAGIDGELQPEIYGIRPFCVKADELFTILSKHNQGELDDSENGYAYAFIEISIGIYRQRIPQDVLEMVEEAKESGEPLSKEEYDCEMRMAEYWATIGLGVEGYYR